MNKNNNNSNEYQGWSNYQTWAVNLHLMNDANTYDFWVNTARGLAEDWPPNTAHAMLSGMLLEMLEGISGHSSPMACDLLTHAIGQVNTDEIATCILDGLE